MRFIEDVGLLSFLKNSRVKSLVDYAYGVEAGMDTNARKNRSGKAMESFIERKVRTACERLGYKYRMEMTAKKVKEELGWNITTDRTNRRFDAVIYNENTRELYIIEANYYGASGTKPSAVTGEFTGLDDSIKNSKDKATFIWVTDGLGWEKGKTALTESFKHVDNIFNMEMLDNDYIYEFLK
ncbi:type II restriction endonuclease [Staphylococcus simulans]|nr:type II restriction endonuclease [Staphylococcus simulans]